MLQLSRADGTCRKFSARPAHCSRSSRSRRVLCRSILQQEPPSSAKQQQQQPTAQSLARQEQVLSLERLLDPKGPEVTPAPPGCWTEPAAGHVFHFAYGANMAFNTLARRAVHIKARDPAIIADAAVCMRFRHRGGYATVERSECASMFPTYRTHVHGVLYELPRGEMEKLKKREGGYTLQDMEVLTYDGRRAMAKVFVSSPLATLAAEVKPTERYMRTLREGAGDNYLDPLYQAWLSSVETVPSAGLPSEYYDTPAKYIAYAFLAVAGLLVAGFFAPQM